MKKQHATACRRWAAEDHRTGIFIRKHDEIPRRMVQDNPKVGSFSQCSNCHNLAEKGIFDEDTVNIPGFWLLG